MPPLTWTVDYVQQGHSGDEQLTKIFMKGFFFFFFLHLLKPLHFDLNSNLKKRKGRA